MPLGTVSSWENHNNEHDVETSYHIVTTLTLGQKGHGLTGNKQKSRVSLNRLKNCLFF